MILGNRYKAETGAQTEKGTREKRNACPMPLLDSATLAANRNLKRQRGNEFR